jgi:ATP-dependent RNA helicase HelY
MPLDESTDEPESRSWDELSEGELDIPTAFDRIIEVLAHFGYLRPAGTDLVISDSGQQLRRIYGERDLLTSLIAEAGILDDLNTAELAALSTVLVYRSNSSVQGSGRKMPTRQMEVALRKLMNVWTELSFIEERQMLPRTREPERGLVHPMYAWASGGTLSEVLLLADTSAGNFVHWVRRSVDLLGQLSKALNQPQSATDRYQQALHLIDRGVAAQSTPMHTQLSQPSESPTSGNGRVEAYGRNEAGGQGT